MYFVHSRDPEGLRALRSDHTVPLTWLCYFYSALRAKCIILAMASSASGHFIRPSSKEHRFLKDCFGHSDPLNEN